MAILTNKMLVASGLNVPDTCISYLPFNEGSGNVVSDIVGNMVQTDNATAEHTTAHAVQFVSTSSLDSGDMPTLLAGKTLVYIDAFVTGTIGASGNNTAYAGLGVSDDTAFGWVSSGGFGVKTSGVASVGANYQSVAATNLIAKGATFNGSTGLLSVYSNKSAGGAALDNTADASAHVGVDITPVTAAGAKTFSIGDSAIGDSKCYGFACYALDTCPTDAEMILIVDWIYNNWILSGLKGHPPQLLTMS